jgi:hypothetical protein
MSDIHNSVWPIHSLYYDSDAVSVKSNSIRISSDNQAIELLAIWFIHTNIHFADCMLIIDYISNGLCFEPHHH